mgnify:CR=1 FL=1
MYYFPGQVGQGKVSWEDLPKHALLRDKVLSAWPKDEAGWPKKLQPAEEAVYLAGLSEEERSTVVGLGGSQKAEVAWMDKHDIPYDELDVGEFGLKYLGMAAEQAKRGKLRKNFTHTLINCGISLMLCTEPSCAIILFFKSPHQIPKYIKS